ncbi:hypothetical protein FG379_002433 [Cryptosporidium bovis]|uniref:uncharacterized protein n=1 Tax=Cryptosporidium bovis TaxID=310047 RepID=UPI00351A034B|nr:hypothetical protein FG379_002433 [Cryptosporidium bovis]
MMGIGTFGGGAIFRRKICWLFILVSCIFVAILNISEASNVESIGVQAGGGSEASASATEEGTSSETSEVSPDISVRLLDPNMQFPEPGKVGDAVTSKDSAADAKIKLPDKPKFEGDIEEVSEGAGISPFDKATSTDDLPSYQFEKLQEGPYIYHMPLDAEKAKLKDIKKLKYTVDPEVSFTEYEIGKDVARDSEMYYSLKEKVANEKKVLSEVLKVVKEAEEYRQNIDSTIRGLVLTVNQIKDSIAQNEEQLKNMKKTGTVPNVSIVAQEDEISRLRLKYQESYGHLMSEKRKRDSAINLSLKAKQQQLNIEERIKRTEDKIRLLEAQLDIHEDSSVPMEALEILKEPEVEIKQDYIPDEYSLAQRRSDVDITPGSYEISHGLEAEESTGAPEESPVASPVRPIVPEISRVPKSQELGTLSVSDISVGSSIGVPKEISEHPQKVASGLDSSSIATATVSSKPVSRFPIFDIGKYLSSALSGLGVSNSDSLFSTKVGEISSNINIINFAMSCLYELDFYLKQLNMRSNTNYSSQDAMKVCRQVWRESFSDMVRFYGTVTPATLRAIFKSSMQNDQEASSTLANYYVEEQFTTMVKHIQVGSASSCKNVVSQLFKSADFQDSLIDLICVNFDKYYNLYSEMVPNREQLMLLASKLAVYASAPYSHDSAPFSNTNDLDQMIMEFDFENLSTSSKLYDQCLKIFSGNYGPGSIYGLSNNSVQSVCTLAQNAFTSALPHGVNVVIFSSKQLSLELIPLLSGTQNISFYGQSVSPQSSEVLLPRDVSVSTGGSKVSSGHSLAPQSVSELSPTLQLSLHTLDEQSKIQKFLEEQQRTIQGILGASLSGADLHKIVGILHDIDSRQKGVETRIIGASPIPEIQATIVALSGDQSSMGSGLGSIGASSIASSKPGEIGIESSLEITVAGFYLDRIASQQDSLSSQISQLEAVLRSPSLSNEDRSITESILKDSESRKAELSKKYEEAVNSVSSLGISVSEGSGLSAGISSSLSPSISVSTPTSKFAFERSVEDLKNLYMEISGSNKDAQKISESLYSTAISDSSLKNELDSVSRKIQRIALKLVKIEKKLQQPNLSFKSKSDLDDFKKTLQKLLHLSRLNIEKLKVVERSNTSLISQQEFGSSVKALSSHSLSPIMTQTAMSQVPLPSSTSKISSLLVKIQRIQTEISKFLSILRTRKLQRHERKSLKKLFSEADPRLSLLLRLVLKAVSGFNSVQLVEFSQRYLDQIQGIYVVEKELLRDYLSLSKRPESSPDGVKINSLIKDLSDKQAQILSALTAGKTAASIVSSRSSAGRIASERSNSASPSRIIEPEYVDATAPGFSKQKLVLPPIPLFKSPAMKEPLYKYSNVRKDDRGVPIVAGPVAGSRVGEAALDYIEKALNRQKISGLYPEGFEVPGSSASKLQKHKTKVEVSVTKPSNRDTFCTRHGYSTMNENGNRISYRIYVKGPRILPRSSVTTIDRRTACNIGSLLQEIRTTKECAKVLYPTLLRLGFSVSQARAEKVCLAIGIDGKETKCSSFNSFRTSSPYTLSQLEESRALSLFSSLSRSLASGSLPKSQLFTQHLVCHIIESMVGALGKGEKFSSFQAYECAAAFEQQASNDGNPLTTSQISVILNSCIEAGFPSSGNRL